MVDFFYERDNFWHRTGVFFGVLILTTIAFNFLYHPNNNDLSLFIALISSSLLVYHFFAKVDIGYCLTCEEYNMNYLRAEEE